MCSEHEKLELTVTPRHFKAATRSIPFTGSGSENDFVLVFGGQKISSFDLDLLSIRLL